MFGIGDLVHIRVLVQAWVRISVAFRVRFRFTVHVRNWGFVSGSGSGFVIRDQISVRP